MNILLPLLMVAGLIAEPELGEGIVMVDLSKTMEIRFFKNKGDQVPDKVVRLIRAGGESAIQEKGYYQWLRPESLKLDYGLFNFRCMRVEGDWILVLINNEMGAKAWIKKAPGLSMVQWENFLMTQTTAIRAVDLEIKTGPEASAPTLRKTTNKNCFEALEIKGDWMKIRTNETLECNEGAMLNEGWIQWRSGNRLAIMYFLSC